MHVSSPARPFTHKSAVNVARPALRVRFVLFASWVLVMLFLATFNLERYPTTWFDEGSHLHVPKTLVQDGVYADKSAEGFRHFGPTTGVGPTVLLPIAGVFSLAGIGLLQARLVMVAYLLFAILAVMLVARRLHGGLAALLTSALLIGAPGVDLLFLGRQVLGEVPALAFLMLGILAWARSTERAGSGGGDLLAGSLAFGLMALTKNQFALILAPSLAALFVVDRLYYRVLRPSHVVLPTICVLAGTALGQAVPLLPLLGTDDLGQTIALAGQASAGAIFVFAPSRILSSLKLILSADSFAYWAVPGLLYGLILARPRDVTGVQNGFLLLVAVLGLGWYAFASIGWARYAFPGLAVTALFVARLLVDLVRAERQAPDERGRWRSLALGCLLMVLIGSTLVGQARSVIGTRDESAQLMAEYLEASVPRSVVIETWEPELGVLTDHAYHYPPSGWLDRAVRAQWLAGSRLPEYDPRDEGNAAYLLVGKFGKYTGIYTPFLNREQPPLVASIGAYDLYWLAAAEARSGLQSSHERRGR